MARVEFRKAKVFRAFMKTPLPLRPKAMALAIGFCCALPLSGNAALLWSSDFESYSSGSAFNIGTSFGGANGAFTAKTSNATFTAQNPSAPFHSGLRGEMEVTGSGASVSLRQIKVDPFGAGDVRIFSLDLAQASGSDMAFSASFLNNINGNLVSSGWGTIGGSSIPTDSLIRVTAVYNQSANSILLPTGDSVASGFAALYYKTEAGAYTVIGTPLAASTEGAGFSLSWSAASIGEKAYFDNIGFWSSATDTYNGVNVLELGPIAAIPEPSVFALGFGGAATLLVRGRRNRARAGTAA